MKSNETQDAQKTSQIVFPGGNRTDNSIEMYSTCKVRKLHSCMWQYAD